MNDPLNFVYGALRSGTTLFGLMLNSHGDISNPGEVDFIFDYLIRNSETDKWSYDIVGVRNDRIFLSYKLSILESDDGRSIVLSFFEQFRQRAKGVLIFNIHRNLDKVSSLMPDAKIIHLVRDPRDVAMSCIGMGWAGTTFFGVDRWLETESSWDRFASIFNNPNNLRDLFYENLIRDPEKQLTLVCEFLGVPYSPKMLDYPSHSTYEAPNPAAIEQWRKRGAERDIALVEIRSKRLMLDRHYKLSGYQLVSPSLLERARLVWRNKIYIWNFAVRRYGFFNYLMEKVTRRFAKPFHSIFLQRINKISEKHLK